MPATFAVVPVPYPEMSPFVDLRELRLDAALALVERPPASDGAWSAGAGSATHYLQDVIDGLCELSLRDPLTGLANRRQFEAVLEREIDRVARSGESALLLILDIDHFKSINDTYGHLAGDQVLKGIARILQSSVRPMDMLARIGGEEFAVVLPGCQSGVFGGIVAERIRAAVESASIPVTGGPALQVTISVGGAFALPWIRSSGLLWADRADTQLYAAKAQGRNRVCIETQADSTVSAEEKSLLFAFGSVDMTGDTDSHPRDASGSAN